jgi:protein O-GlcNAc transferase
VEAHTKVDVIVDLQELRALLQDRLPHVWAGAAVAAARREWPRWPEPGDTAQQQRF